MGGKILEYEAKTIYRKGYEEGYKEGYKEGLREGREESIKFMVSELQKLDTPTEIILKVLQDKCSLSLETAKKYV